jgi:V/A-type H+-transporting ATPase subunit E
MAFEDIINKITEDTQSEADSILSLARAEAEAVREKGRRQAEELRAGMIQKAEERAKEHAARIETLAGLELRKEALKEKKDLIGEVFKTAMDKIRNLPPEEYLAFLRPIILDAVESGKEELLPSSVHRNMFTSDFLNSLNEELGPQKGHLRLSEERGDFSGGVVLLDGKKETNLTLNSLLESQRDKLEPLVANILFGEGKKDG